MATTPPSPKPHSPTFRISIKTAARKLPVKRKSSPPQTLIDPTPLQTLTPSPISFIKPEPDQNFLSSPEPTTTTTANPPLKFHRIWPEEDELRFLQALIKSSNDGMRFPRDMHVFYSIFTKSMTLPYTKSQLSEKLRRLKKKFRVVSSKLARGVLDLSLMPSHERTLFDLSKQFWRTAPISPSPLKKAKITPPSLLLLPPPPPPAAADCNSLFHGEPGLGFSREMAAKAVLDVLDESLNEVRMVLVGRGSSEQGKCADLQKRWDEQRVAELDVLACRLKLVLEDAVSDSAKFNVSTQLLFDISTRWAC